MIKSNKISSKKIAKNLIFSFSAQVLSLSVSFILGFIVPKFLSAYQYSYWQTFLLYINYVTLCHFGLLDGILLRYAQYDYDELDKPRIRSQFYLLSLLLVVIAGVLISISLFVDTTINKEIIILVALGVLSKNIFSYTSYTLQITNKISHYAFAVIIQRLVYAGIILLLIVFQVDRFEWYCIADLAGDICGILVGFLFTRGLYIGKSIPFKNAVAEFRKNIITGIFMTIASFSGGFIIIGARTIIQWNWDALIFGQLSFSFSVSMAFVSFATAIGVVLFPSLKRMKEEDLPQFYLKLRDYFNLFLFAILILYFPGCQILKLWLPNYADSLPYLGILLPMIVSYARLSLLTNNYLKAYRKEKKMLMINIISIGVAFIIFLLSAYVFHSLKIILYTVVFSIMLRSVLSELVIARIVKNKITGALLIEFCMTICFMLSIELLPLWLACLVYSILFILYSVYYRKSFLSLCRSLIGMLRHERKKTDL